MILLATNGNWSSFTGRIHPLVVHLPIGILLIAVLLLLLSRWPRWQRFRNTIPFLFLAAFLAALCSCLTGYLLSQDGGYDDHLLDTHRNLGIAVAVISGIMCIVQSVKKLANRIQIPLAVLLLVLISAAGHYGGSLTHGDNYLTAAMPPVLQRFSKGDIPAVAAYKDISDARVYEDLVQPVLNERCISCHSQQKLKGGLQLESLALMRKGGENGPVLKDSMPEESELFKRLLLPESDEHRMPPKGKPSLSPAETELLHWWIASGAPAGKKVKDLPKNPRIMAVLAAMQPAAPIDKQEFVPEREVAQAGKVAIQALTDKGLKVLQVGDADHHLAVSGYTAGNFSDKDISLLLPVKEQLIWLDLSGTAITDAGMSAIGQLPHLTRLDIRKTAIQGKTLQELNHCTDLRYLNIGQNNCSAADIGVLKGNKNLQQLYLNETQVNKSMLSQLQHDLPGLKIDTGGYQLPALASDTIEYHKTAKL
ncbi:c-type cytochrome domain-containing protein [Chitinophaga sp. Cy-1792]|uniref:c-type cytochrome domain-containing protein n=1 Tax=Chitinophaga sp. Cy-1792 TaxID=2608339 RepID=UPI0014213AAA|nr:c-type cytochrome domain-containing protein [Chitinophaga sp. Cy-1792]NIG57547.1 hypothetical protein [Chitinophaga sp. Cy-1792]